MTTLKIQLSVRMIFYFLFFHINAINSNPFLYVCFAALAFIRRVALALNAALSFNNKNNADGSAGGGGDQGGPPAAAAAAAAAPPVFARQRVYGATLVRGVPYYGYHPQEKLWIKLMMYDPRDVGRAASLLLAGAVLGRSFQPHESHVPYLLALKIDLNLHGMGYVTLSKALFREKLPAMRAMPRQGWTQRTVIADDHHHHLHHHHLTGDTSPSVVMMNHPLSASVTPGSKNTPPPSLSWKVWEESSVPVSMRWGVGNQSPPRQSTCDLEVDGCVEDVLDRKGVLRIPLCEAGPETRMIESVAPMWEEERVKSGTRFSAPPDVPRTPQQLSPAVAAFREQFQAVEAQLKAKFPEMMVVDDDDAVAAAAAAVVHEGGQQSQLFMGLATQAANEAVFPSGGGSGAHVNPPPTVNTALGVFPPPPTTTTSVPPIDDFDYFVDVDETILMTQLPVMPLLGGEEGGAEVRDENYSFFAVVYFSKCLSFLSAG